MCRCRVTATAASVNLSTKDATRSSPQWWSGRSTTPTYLLDLRSPIWGVGQCCKSVTVRRHSTTSKRVLKFAALLGGFRVRLYPTVWLNVQRGSFRYPVSGKRSWRCVSWIRPFDWPQMVLVTSRSHPWSSSCRFRRNAENVSPIATGMMPMYLPVTLPVADAPCDKTVQDSHVVCVEVDYKCWVNI